MWLNCLHHSFRFSIRIHYSSFKDGTSNVKPKAFSRSSTFIEHTMPSKRLSTHKFRQCSTNIRIRSRDRVFPARCFCRFPDVRFAPRDENPSHAGCPHGEWEQYIPLAYSSLVSPLNRVDRDQKWLNCGCIWLRHKKERKGANARGTIPQISGIGTFFLPATQKNESKKKKPERRA